jgi:hypothetical protein
MKLVVAGSKVPGGGVEPPGGAFGAVGHHIGIMDTGDGVSPVILTDERIAGKRPQVGTGPGRPGRGQVPDEKVRSDRLARLCWPGRRPSWSA